ncbi:MAG: amidase family protein, partial [Geminicoccales bacterium]
AVRNALHRAAELLSRRGMRVEPLDLPDSFTGLLEASPLIMRSDGAVSLATEYRDHRDRMSEFARRSVAAGAATGAAALAAAWALVESCTAAFDVLAGDHDGILTPSAPGEAPATLESTGDAAFNRLWTALHAPCLALPAGIGPAGLPIGIQLVGRRYGDRHLLAVAQRVEGVLRDGGV